MSVRPVDPEVHRQVLLGRHHAAKTTEEGLRTAVQHFNVAIAKDPDMALAHAGLAQAYTELAGFYMDPREAMPKAKRAAETALRLDESVADAHAALGYIHLVYDWDGPAAQRELLRALDLNSTLATARLNYAAYLSTQARHDEAVREVRRAVDLDPRSIRTNAFGTVLLLFTRRYDEAIDLSRKGLEFEPDSAFTLAFQGVAYAQIGRFEEAVANVHRAAQLDRSLTILALQAQVLAMAGRKQQAEMLIHHVQDAAKRQYFCPYEIACVYVSLGDRDTAYALFRKGTDEHADCMAWLGVEPWVDSFRSDPRYGALVRRIGLAPNGRQAPGPSPNH
jgi:tetratricopeptide (TPR) repeat protein